MAARAAQMPSKSGKEFSVQSKNVATCHRTTRCCRVCFALLWMPHVVVLAPPCPPRIAPDLAKEEKNHVTQHMTIQDPLSIAGQQDWMQLPIAVELFCMRQKKVYQNLAYWCLPVVPHKAVAEVSKIGNL